MNKVIIVGGATAVGKTDFSFDLAERYDGEIICADSAQIYKYMDIGTAKPTDEERKRYPHHLFDFVDLTSDYSVSDYSRDVRKAIDEVLSRNKTPILVGGTGLYIHSVLYDMDFNTSKPDLERRKVLLEKPAEDLALMLEDMGVSLSNSDRYNVRRLVRMIEILESGSSLKKFSETREKQSNYDVDLYILERDRKELYDRINKRVDIMVEQGLVSEVLSILDMGLSGEEKSMKAIGYKEVIEHLRGETCLDEMIEKIKVHTRHYAKRQITWFKKYDFGVRMNLTSYYDI